MRIAIDATAMPAKRAGAGAYTYELVRALARNDERNHYTIFARRGAFEDVVRPGFRVEVVEGPRGLDPRVFRAAWEQTMLPARLAAGRYDVMHSPHHTLPAAPCGVARVVTIHDVTFHLLPRRYPAMRRTYMRMGTRMALFVAHRAIVPSCSVARDMHRVFPRLSLPLEVVPEAASSRFFVAPPQAQLASVRTRYGLPDRYVLNVSTIEPGKNQAALVRAIATLADEGLPHHLVIAGQFGWLYGALLEQIERLQVHERVHLLGYVPDEDLPALYRLADAFAFPSLHEGFGLPPLEAMASETPVVAVRASSLPEVIGEAGLLVPPGDDRALTAALRSVLTDEPLRDELIERGRARAAAFSWDEAACRTIEVYQRATAERDGSA